LDLTVPHPGKSDRRISAPKITVPKFSAQKYVGHFFPGAARSDRDDACAGNARAASSKLDTDGPHRACGAARETGRRIVRSTQRVTACSPGVIGAILLLDDCCREVTQK